MLRHLLLVLRHLLLVLRHLLLHLQLLRRLGHALPRHLLLRRHALWHTWVAGLRQTWVLRLLPVALGRRVARRLRALWPVPHHPREWLSARAAPTRSEGWPAVSPYLF